MPRGKTQKSLDLIKACSRILEEIQPATIRAVCYRLFVAGQIRSMARKDIRTVYDQLKDAREREAIPWAWIVDETRAPEYVPTWRDPDTFLRGMLRSYRRDYWALQPHCVEVWSEKGTVRGTLAPVLDAYGVTFRVMHGFGSATAVHDVAFETQYNPQPLVVLYVGDWDPSGLYMSEHDLPARLNRYGQRGMRWLRAALTPGQIQTHNLPGFSVETKHKDSRYAWFCERYGRRCWELDALNPVVLREDVERFIREAIEPESWGRCQRTEAAERESFSTVIGTWRQYISGQVQE